MPHFQAILDFPSDFSPEQKATIGRMYLLPIAPPDDDLGDPSHYAFFYPDKSKTVLGTAALAAFGNRRTKELRIVVRMFSNTDDDQTVITIPWDEVVDASEDLPPNYVKIGGKAIRSFFSFPGDHYEVWPYRTSRQRMSLTAHRSGCTNRKQLLSMTRT